MKSSTVSESISNKEKRKRTKNYRKKSKAMNIPFRPMGGDTEDWKEANAKLGGRSKN